MKRISIALLYFFILLYSVPCIAQNADEIFNKVINGGFEVASDGIPKSWSVAGQKDALSIDKQVFHGGAQSVRIFFPQNSVEGLSLSMLVDVEATQRYDFAGYIKTESIEKGFAQIYVQFFDKDKKALERVSFPEVTGTSEWQNFHQWVVAPPGADSARVTCFASGQGKVWFDDIQFTGKLEGGY